MSVNQPGMYPMMGVYAYDQIKRKAEADIRKANGIEEEKRSLGDIAEESAILGTAGAGLFAGLPWLFTHRKNMKQTLTNMKNAPAKFERSVDSFMRQANDVKARKILLDSWQIAKGMEKPIYYASSSLMNADRALSAQYLKKAQQAYAEKMGPGFFSRMKTKLSSKISPLVPQVIKDANAGFKNTVVEPVKKFVAESPKLSKTAEFFKGKGGAFLGVIEGAVETFTEIIPAFREGGFFGGLKQIGKSAVKVGAVVAGWIAGEAAGSTIGAGIGAAIGSVIPVVGTAIGASIGSVIGGFIGGFFTSSVAGEVAKKVTGKSVKDEIRDEKISAQAQEVATNFMFNPNQMNIFSNPQMNNNFQYVPNQEYLY